jgi:endonuclease-3
MLSSQTKDTTNAIAMRRLQTELSHPGLTLENILALSPEKLNELIWVVGFQQQRHIKATALILRDQWESDIPIPSKG